MRNYSFRIAKLTVIVALAASSFAQVRRSTTLAAGNQTSTKIPYTAEYHVSSVQTLTNGSTITRDYTETRAVDSQGKSIFQTTTPQANEAPIVHSFVIDSVAHTTTDWNSKTKKAIVRPYGSAAASSNCSTDVSRDNTTHPPVSGSQPKSTTEKLGTQTIQGIEARGLRITTTIAAGEIGNDAPLVKTYEVWSATNPGLHRLMVRSSTDDPRFGTNSRELTSFTQSDPDASLFSPPSDYEIVTKQATGGCPTDAATVSSPSSSQN